MEMAIAGKAIEEPASYCGFCTAHSCPYCIYIKSLLLLALSFGPPWLSWLVGAFFSCCCSICSKQFCVAEAWRRESQTQFSFPAVSCTVEPPVVSIVTFRLASCELCMLCSLEVSGLSVLSLWGCLIDYSRLYGHLYCCSDDTSCINFSTVYTTVLILHHIY